MWAFQIKDKLVTFIQSVNSGLNLSIIHLGVVTTIAQANKKPL